MTKIPITFKAQSVSVHQQIVSRWQLSNIVIDRVRCRNIPALQVKAECLLVYISGQCWNKWKQCPWTGSKSETIRRMVIIKGLHPIRSRAAKRIFSCLSHIAKANIPWNRFTHPGPHFAYAARMTSVSLLLCQLL